MKRFLWRIGGHTEVGNCEVFLNFLRTPIVGMKSCDRINRTDSQTSISCESSPGTTTTSSSYLKPVLDSLSDVTATIFSRSPKKIPDSFINLKKDVKIIKNHLSQLERLFSNRVMGYQPAIIEGMKEIASNFDELSLSIDLNLCSSNSSSYGNKESIGIDQFPVSPPFVKSMLSRVSATMTQCAHLLDKSIDDQELNLLAVLLEYTQYCDSAMEIIEMRDRRQVEVEELEILVEGYEKEISSLEGGVVSVGVLGAGADDSNNKKDDKLPAQSATKSNFFDYLNTKWDSWKGVDPITSKKNRLQKCHSRLKQAQSALKTSSSLSERADNVLSLEISTFITGMKEELGREFGNHARAQVRYHETSLVYWKDFLDWLDNPPKHL